MKLTKKLIMDRLKTVMDPEIDANIVSMGLIYDVAVKEDKIKITMTLTNPACPFAKNFIEDIRASMQGLVADIDRDVDINIVFDPPWNLDMMDKQLRQQLGI